MATLAEFPGCCGIDVLHDLDARDGYPISVRIAQADLPVTLATTSSENSKESIVALEKGGFVRLISFDNTESGNEVTLWVKGHVKRIRRSRALPAKRRVR